MKYDAPCSHSAASQPRRASQIIEARARCICTAVLASVLVARLMTKNVTGLIAVDKPILRVTIFLPISILEYVVCCKNVSLLGSARYLNGDLNLLGRRPSDSVIRREGRSQQHSIAFGCHLLQLPVGNFVPISHFIQ